MRPFSSDLHTSANLDPGEQASLTWALHAAAIAGADHTTGLAVPLA